jgi:hypothetical protein
MAILPSEALTGYSYSSNILISNSTGTAYTSRIKFQVPALNLVTGNYIQSDGEDARITDSSGIEESSLVKNLTSNTAYWTTDIISIPAHGDVNRTLWTGNTTATKDQSWIGSDGDTNTIADAADLDITTNLTLKTDIYVPSLPATEKKIISKDGAYELAVDNTNFIFKTWLNATSVEYLRPNGAGDSTQLSPSVGTNWQTVDEDPVSDADYNQTVTDGAETDYYNLGATALTASDQIVSVTAYHRSAGSIAGACHATPLLRLAGVTTTGATVHVGDYAFAYNLYGEVLDRPGGGSWTIADLNSLQVGITLQDDPGLATRISQEYVGVTYRTPRLSQIAATTGAWKTIICMYDGDDQVITDGALIDTDDVTDGALATNSNNISVAIVTAKFDSLKIGDTSIIAPVWKANFEFEPDEISATTINDLSAGGLNDITYSLGANPAGITVTLGSLTSTDETTTIEGEALIEAGALGELNSPGNTTGDPENVGPGTDFDTFVNVIPDTTDTPAYMVWVWLYVFCMLITVAITLRYSGGHFFIGGIAALFITGAFVAMGSGNGNSIIPWWFLLLDGIGIVGLLAMEKNSVP